MNSRAWLFLVANEAGSTRVLGLDAFVGLVLEVLAGGLLRVYGQADDGCEHERCEKRNPHRHSPLTNFPSFENKQLNPHAVPNFASDDMVCSWPQRVAAPALHLRRCFRRIALFAADYNVSGGSELVLNHRLAKLAFGLEPKLLLTPLRLVGFLPQRVGTLANIILRQILASALPLNQAARRFRVRAAFLADRERAAAGREVAAFPPRWPPLREGE
ncbi:hypothetical protein M2202_008832 [Bradyrhizobium japonicum]|nr:hypothetical protein [Bradyrhizobium japonicum]